MISNYISKLSLAFRLKVFKLLCLHHAFLSDEDLQYIMSFGITEDEISWSYYTFSSGLTVKPAPENGFIYYKHANILVNEYLAIRIELIDFLEKSGLSSIQMRENLKDVIYSRESLNCYAMLLRIALSKNIDFKDNALHKKYINWISKKYNIYTISNCLKNGVDINVIDELVLRNLKVDEYYELFNKKVSHENAMKILSLEITPYLYAKALDAGATLEEFIDAAENKVSLYRYISFRSRKNGSRSHSEIMGLIEKADHLKIKDTNDDNHQVKVRITKLDELEDCDNGSISIFGQKIYPEKSLETVSDADFIESLGDALDLLNAYTEKEMEKLP